MYCFCFRPRVFIWNGGLPCLSLGRAWGQNFLWLFFFGPNNQVEFFFFGCLEVFGLLDQGRENSKQKGKRKKREVAPDGGSLFFDWAWSKQIHNLVEFQTPILGWWKVRETVPYLDFELSLIFFLNRQNPVTNILELFINPEIPDLGKE